MATIGTVKTVNGQFGIVNENGETIALQEGQILKLGDAIQGKVQQVNGEFQVVDENGQVLEVIDGQALELDTTETLNQVQNNTAIVQLNNGQEIVVNNQNPLVLDNTVLNNVDTTETVVPINTINDLTNDLADETNLVTQNENGNDTEQTDEQKEESDSSHARVLDRNADIANVVATLREPVIDFREPEEKIIAEDISYINARVSITGGNLVYEGDKINYTFTLTDTPTVDVIVKLSFSGTAVDGTDYTVIKEVIIPKGSKTATLTISTIDDYLSDNNENYTIKIIEAKGGGYTSLSIDPINNSVTTTIIDDSKPNTPNNPNDGVEPNGLDSVTVKLVSTDSAGNILTSSQIAEGQTAYYKVILVDPSGNQITSATGNVDITFTDGTALRTGTAANGGADFTGTNATVALNTVFSAVANDDYISDSGETFNVQITDDTYTNASAYENVVHDTTAVVTTIIDDSGTPNIPNDGVESSHESVIIKLVALNSNGTPALDGSGNYTFANSVNEGSDAKYMVLAFAPNETVFSPSTKLDNQIGNVDLTFVNITAIGTSSQTVIDGSEDYNNTAKVNVTLGTVLSTSTFDDYLSDNNETFSLSITNNSYEPSIGGYENVSIDTNSVVTTIMDGSNDKTPNETTDTIYVKITGNNSAYEGDKISHTLTLVDKNGSVITVPSGETITVNLSYTPASTNGAASGDYVATTSAVITAGNSSIVFENQASLDSLIELNESYIVSILSVSQSNGTYENIEKHPTLNSVTGTIKDGVDAVADTATVAEGSNTISGNILDNDEKGTAGKITTFDYKDESGNTQTATLVSGTATVDTIYGSITINENGNWSFISDLTENHSAGDLFDTITYTVANGSKTDTSTLTIKVTDTIPTAVADTKSIIEDVVSVSDNVFTNDTIGADTTATPVTGVKAGSDTLNDATTDVGSDVTGTYGKVNIAANGTYTYTLDNANLNVQELTTGETLTDTFTYTITDSDGDISTTTLTITINGADDGVTVTIPNDTTGTKGDISDHVVYESGLSDGSAPDANDLKVDSNFTIEALDGLKELVVGGTRFTVAQIEALGTTNQTVDTTEGTLVLNGYSKAVDGTITVDYEYTLKDNITHDKTTNDTFLNDAIIITANDTDTGTHTQTLNIKIVDDVPIAVADTNAITEDASPNTVSANVINNTTDDSQDDTVGADGATVTAIKNSADTAGTVGSSLSGTYGSIVLDSTGEYTYTLDNANLNVQELTTGETLTDTFTYTITDSDGDTSTTTLTITINGADDGVTVTIPNNTTGTKGYITDHVVYESGLSDGSAPDANDLKVDSNFTIEALDGLKELVVGGTRFTVAQIEALGTTNQTVDTTEGTLVLNGYSKAVDGTITVDYEYTLKDNITHDKTTNDTFLNDAIIITANDTDTGTHTQTLNIKIVDDVPIAVADTNAITEDASPNTVSANVINNTTDDSQDDTVGADGVTVTAIKNSDDTAGTVGTSLDGTYGSIVLDSTGEYTYTLDNANLNVQELTTGETLTDTFTYTITDSDGDTSTTTLTITINGADDGVTVTIPNDTTGTKGYITDHVVYESGLSDGSAPNVNDLKVDSNFTIEALDGLKELVVGGTTLTKTQVESITSSNTTSIDTGEGTLVLNGYSKAADGTVKIDYVYTLKDNVDSRTITKDDISITVKDTDATADTQTSTLSIAIVDDVPTAKDNSATVVEGATAILGNVITDNDATAGTDIQGADTAKVNSFTYTDASNNSQTVTFTDANPQTVTTKDGSLTVNPNGYWSFTPNTSVLQPTDTTKGSFTYTLIDTDGDISNSATNTISVTDTAPTIATVTTVSVDEDDLTSGSDISKETLSVESSLQITAGKDNFDTTFNITEGSVSGLTSNGAQVYYYLSADNKTLTASTSTTEGGVTSGNTIFTDTLSNTTTESAKHTFVLSGAIDHQTASAQNTKALTFAYKVIDSDGSSATNSFIVNIVDDVPTAQAEPKLSVVEGNVALTGMVNLLDNDVKGADQPINSITSFTYTNESGNVVSGTFGNNMDTKYGTLVVNTDGTWTYTSDASENQSSTITDSFTYVITDKDGDTSSAVQQIDVTDGANPTIDNSNNTLVKVYEGDSKSTFNGTDNYAESNSDSNKSTTSKSTHKLDFTKGTDDAGITSFTFDGTTQSIAVGSSATITDNDKGTLKVFYDGTWEYTPPATYIHPDGDSVNNFQTTFTYTVTDTDGDAVTTGSQTIQVDDTLALLGSTTAVTIDEKNLSTGTNPDNNELTKGGTINVDTSNLSGAHDITFASSQLDTTLLNTALSSYGEDISYVVSSDGHTLTMYTGTDSTLNHVMVVTINNPTSATPTYTAVLSKAFDHELALLENGNLEFDFNISLTDDDKDTGAQTFKVSIVDDEAPISQTMTIDEDSSSANAANTITTNADATQSNTTIKTQGLYGDGSIDANGKFVYVPDSNFSGVDTVTYEITLDDGTKKDITVTITVNPISDAPTLTSDAGTVYTLEDTAVALGFNAPTVTDVIDQNGSGIAGNNPELLSVITLTGIPSGVKVLSGTGTDLFTSTGSAITIKLSDGSHVSGLSGETLTMTIAEFEALKVLPVSQSATDFKVIMSVTEYEVDDSGNILSGIAGAKQNIIVNVDVLAVTDPVDLKINNTATVNEDTALDLRALLSTGAFDDLDGSENRTIEITGIPSGTIINGTTVTNGTYSIALTGSSNDTIPSLSLTPPKNFSGDITGITITLVAHDTDSDSTYSDGTTGTTTLANTTIYDTQDSVTLNITVNPIADDIADMAAKTTYEDTAVIFLNDLDLTDKDTAGTESITKLVITGLNEGSVILYNGVSTTIDNSGTFTIGDGNSDLVIATIQAATITPPAHSSKDMSITVTATVKDVNSTTSTIDYSETFALVVNPIAEKTNTNTAGTVANDIITQGNHTYTTKAMEDIYFNLNSADNGFSLSLTNEDNVETTTVLFTPKDENGNKLDGTIFKYGTTELTFTGTAIEIPVSQLANLQVKAPPQYSGKLVLTTEVKSIDYDDDALNKEAANTQISAGDTLTITVDPVTDPVTLAVSPAYGLEDAGRTNGNLEIDANRDEINNVDGAISLNIKTTSVDSSEIFIVTIDKVPSGGALYYDGSLLTGTLNGDGTFKYEITDFKNNLLLKFVPPYNSDEDYNFSVTAVTQDGDAVASTPVTLNLPVTVKDVADPLINNDLATATATAKNGDYTFNVVKTEDYLDSNNNKFLLKDIYGNNPNIDSYDSDGSEVQTFTVTGLEADFSIEGATFLGGTGTSRKWLVDLADLKAVDKVYVTLEKHFSGEFNFTIKEISTEKSGSSYASSDRDISVMVTPSVEATLTNLSVVQTEDEWKELSFTFNTADTDGSEARITSLKDISINLNDLTTAEVSLRVDGIDISGTGYHTITLTNGVIPKIEVLNKEHSDANYNFGIKYTVADTISDGAGNTYENSIEKTATYNVTVNAVTEKNLTLDVNTDTITIDARASFTKTVTLKSPDIDGSEEFTRIVVSGVPDGIEVQDGIYVTGGIWYVDINPDLVIDNANGKSYNLTFNPNGYLSTSSGNTITIKAFAQDNPSSDGNNTPAIEESVSDTFNIDISITGDGGGTAPATITKFEKINNPISDEDGSFKLRDFIDVEINGSSKFSVKISGDSLPDGVVISGTGVSKIGGFWIVSGTGDTDAVKTALDGVTITPPANFSTNNNPANNDELMKFDLLFTTYGTNGKSESKEINDFDATVTPNTDKMDFDGVSKNLTTLEDTKKTINLDLTNSKDSNAYTTIVDGKVYVKVSGGDVANGTLEYGGNTITTTNVSGVPDILNGDYYVLTVSPSSPAPTSVSFDFTPAANKKGDVRFDVYTKNQETLASDIETSHGTYILSVGAVADDIIVIINGNNNITATEDTIIEVPYSVTISDTDESIKSIILENIPNNYLVYYGESGNLSLAKNISGSWSISTTNGATPKIWIEAPENSSDTIAGITLKVISDGGKSGVSNAVNVNITAVADDITINPTPSIGNEYTWIDMNLNAVMKDIDGSETLTIKLKGDSTVLDTSAIFRYSDGTIINSAIFDNSDKSWSISGITYDKINDIQMMYHQFNNDITITANTNDGSSSSSTVSGTLSLKINSSNNITTGNENNNIDVSLHSDNVTINAGEGNNIINSGTGDDNITTGSGNDTITSTGGNNTINTGDGTNSVTTGSGNDNITAGNGNNTINAGDGTNSITTGSGDDTITTGSGNDTINAGAGADTINAGAANDIITFDKSDSFVDGGAGTDTLILDTGIDMDFDSIANITNIEKIDLSETGANKVLNLNIDDVINITDNNILEILGDNSDTVQLKTDTNGTWEKTVTNDNGFDTYSKVGDNGAVTLKIDTDIITNII